jgi:uroporphyrin-III C-methyltransferase/precorrin-2 dehydrogenase/sirohydrochlorin ferrochelatase
MPAYFPVALDLHGRRCLVVGGGVVATRKVEALLDAGATVVVVAPRLLAEVEALGVLGALEVQRRDYEATDCNNAFLVIAATDDRATNAAIATDARASGALVNAADDPEHCDFITPAIVRRGDVQVAVTTGGASPALARHLRERLENLLAPEYGELADLLARVRRDLRQRGVRATPDQWQQAIEIALAGLRAGGPDAAEETLSAFLTRTRNPEPPTSNAVSEGRIVLVGAGPGDPGLLTLAGRDAIGTADTVVYDRLVNAALLDLAPPHAELIYAGKQRGGKQMSQAEINDLLCAEARAGKLVVRLKGGDPFVFGRGGEEALAARAAGVPCTVIPGVSAAVAVPAAAGIPVTHRGLSAAFTVVTGHEDPAKADGAVDWEALAQVGGTLVLLMAVETLPEVCNRLLACGLDADTPAAVIHAGTTRDQQVVTGTVATIGGRASAAAIRAPATTVIGEVAGLADILAPQGDPFASVGEGSEDA